jgi:hypothetical protein
LNIFYTHSVLLLSNSTFFSFNVQKIYFLQITILLTQLSNQIQRVLYNVVPNVPRQLVRTCVKKDHGSGPEQCRRIQWMMSLLLHLKRDMVHRLVDREEEIKHLILVSDFIYYNRKKGEALIILIYIE